MEFFHDVWTSSSNNKSRDHGKFGGLEWQVDRKKINSSAIAWTVDGHDDRSVAFAAD